MKRFLFPAFALLVLVSCSSGQTVDDARAFIADVEKELEAASKEAGQAAWVQATYITQDTEALAARSYARVSSLAVKFAKEAKRFDGVDLPEDLARKMKLLKLGFTLAVPEDPAEAQEVTEIGARMEGLYGKGEYCLKDPAPGQPKCLEINAIEQIMASSREPDELLRVWKGWRTISPPMRNDYTRFVELSNKGARELGFADTGAMWRSGYDMPAEDLPKELDRLWEQVKPLYESLHAYVRMKLRDQYGSDVPAKGPIPAHLLGNIWAQDWSNIYPLVAPAGADPGYDLTKILQDRKVDPIGMVKYGEGFFTSLGFAPLPQTFWERSLFVKPRDRDVVCHASAWDMDPKDYRIKMCIEINAEDFTTIHHELGHNFYQRAYNQTQPVLFRGSANDGFHEAIGDTIALSITPEYLVQLGFLDKPTDPSKDIGLLLQRALEKVAFLPFGIMIDQWRWKVFSGEVTPADYNKAWWELREQYQGVAAPVARTEADFDPGAKYHVPANVPYTRYFLAHILQFQFHRALAQAAGCTTPLHRCSIYNSKEAGAKLNAMLELGMSRPWQEALESMTGSRQMDATAILDYFAPLKAWLDAEVAKGGA